MEQQCNCPCELGQGRLMKRVFHLGKSLFYKLDQLSVPFVSSNNITEEFQLDILLQWCGSLQLLLDEKHQKASQPDGSVELCTFWSCC